MDPRKKVFELLVPEFYTNDKLFLLVGDMGFGKIDDVEQRFPDRVLNCGIMEQGMLGIAAGMALAGWKPIVYSIYTFLIFRGAEQIRLDIVGNELPVKLLGTGAGNYFLHLGRSHSCGREDLRVANACGLKEVFDGHEANDESDYERIFCAWLDSSLPAYLRV